MDLLSSLLEKGQFGCTDNFYSSPQLFQDLLDKSILASETECRNRKKSPINLDVTSKISRADSKFVVRISPSVIGLTTKMFFACQNF